MLTEHTLAQLGRLNQQRAVRPARPGVAVSAQPVAGNGSESSSETTQSTPQVDAPLEGAAVTNQGGCHWKIEKPVESLWPDYQRHWRRFQDRRRVARGVPASHPQLEQLATSLLDDVLLLDLETCGFAGSMVFLIGLLFQQEGRLQLVQLLARNYAEERAVLHSLWHAASRKPMLVTFNGKCFDWPMVQDRTTLHRLPAGPMGRVAAAKREAAGTRAADTWKLPEQWEHCDLLHHARRRWKGRLPNCRLQTLEWHVCGRRRTGDIPGREIPDAYHHFVRTGNPAQMRSILHHNALDLVTLLQLALALT